MKRIDLVNISKSYDRKRHVLSDIHVTIEPGEFFVIVGPSGCGKSTLLRMIAGLEKITGGILKVENEEVNHLPASKRGLSMVFQNYALYPHLTVEENIVFGLKAKKVCKSERNQRCEEAADLLGLTEYLNRKPRELSGGQRQRVALARTIVSRSPICLMDEPLSNLDAKLRAKMRAEIKRIQQKFGMTLIYVTHDQVEAMTMGDRMMILSKGIIQQLGRPIDIYNEPANLFVADFIGSPPMNLINGIILHSTAEISLNHQYRIKVPREAIQHVRSNRIKLGIRPEKIRMNEEVSSIENTFLVKVTNVEILGYETIISFEMGEEEWKAKWNGQRNVREGEMIPIVMDAADLCLFDRKTGENISLRFNQPTFVQKEVMG